MKIESSQRTDVLLFKRFINNYMQFTTDMNNMHFSINSPHCPIPDHKKENVIFFLKSIDKLNNKYEGDSKELFKSGCFAVPVDGQMDGEIEFM